MPPIPPAQPHQRDLGLGDGRSLGPVTGSASRCQVTAFNGHEKHTLFLHSYAPSANNTSVLVGKLKRKGPKGYGNQLDVTIPPLLAGAISRFTTTVKNGKYVPGPLQDEEREVAGDHEVQQPRRHDGRLRLDLQAEEVRG